MSSSPAQIFITIHQEDPTALIETKLLPFISAQQGLAHSPEQRLVTTGDAPTAGDGAACVAGKSREIFIWKGWFGVQSLEVSKE